MSCTVCPGERPAWCSKSSAERRAGWASWHAVLGDLGLRCVSLLTLADLIDIMAQPTTGTAPPSEHLDALRAYRAQYGIQP